MPMPSATTHTCSPKCTPSIINATRSNSPQGCGEQVGQRGLGGRDEAAADRGLARRRRRLLDLLADRFEPGLPAAGGDPGQHLGHRHAAQHLGAGEQLVGGHRQLAGAVGRTHPRPLNRHTPSAQGDRALLAAVPHRAPGRVVLALRPAHRGHVGVHHRGHHLQPRAHSHRQQALAHVGDDLAERDAHGIGHGECRRGSIDRLVVLFHSGPLFWTGVDLAVAQHLPQGRRQAGDRHLKFHDVRGNLLECRSSLAGACRTETTTALSRPGNAVKPAVTELPVTEACTPRPRRDPIPGTRRRGHRPRCPLMDMEGLRPRHGPP